MPEDRKIRVGVYVELLGIENRDVLRGISAFMDGQADWDVRLESPTPDGIQKLHQGHYDGYIIRHTRNIIREGIECPQHLPGVNFSDSQPETSLPRVCSDNLAVGRQAGEYFSSRGYQDFAIVTEPDHYGFQLRRQGFLDSLPGKNVHTVEPTDAGITTLLELVKESPCQLAVYCTKDTFAAKLVRACSHQHIRIPEDIAILGGMENAITCIFNSPRLSTISSNPYRIGYAACALLAKQLSGESFEREVLIAPGGVITRASTDMLATTDTALLSALQFIRNHYHRQVIPEEVADHVGVSRRNLDRKFQRAFSRTITEELSRVRVEAAKRLLITTEEPLMHIAERCGYVYPERFGIVFQRLTGLTPATFRSRFRV